MSVFIGSRDEAKGKRVAASIGCEGGGHQECLEKSNFILLCIMPGPDSISFVDYAKPIVVGKGKMFCDMSASYTRFYSDAQRAPEPYKSHLNYLKGACLPLPRIPSEKRPPPRIGLPML